MYTTVLEYLNKVPLEEPEFYKGVVDTCGDHDEEAAAGSRADR